MKRILIFAALAMLLAGCVLPCSAAVYVDTEKPEDWPQRNLMRLTVFRTGESDCMLLEQGGEAMMIDGGIYKYRDKLRDALDARGLSRMKYYFNTHPHEDHIDGLYGLLGYGFTCDEFLATVKKSFKASVNDHQVRCVKRLDKMEIPYTQLLSGDTITLGDVTMTLYIYEKGASMDAKSPLIRVEYGDVSMLLTTDIIGDTQKYFLKTLPPEVLKADIVKAPHHGLTGFVKEFLDAVEPEYIFCTNYYNLDLVGTMNGQALYRSLPIQYSGAGRIEIETDGTDWYVVQYSKEF